ncbi:hypothetical protein RSAG8_01738, partial [Rhizoctonia solani AG-8 WAC10335]
MPGKSVAVPPLSSRPRSGRNTQPASAPSTTPSRKSDMIATSRATYSSLTASTVSSRLHSRQNVQPAPAPTTASPRKSGKTATSRAAHKPAAVSASNSQPCSGQSIQPSRAPSPAPSRDSGGTVTSRTTRIPAVAPAFSSRPRSEQSIQRARVPSPTPSRESGGTATSRITSASKLADSPEDFLRWARGVQLDTTIWQDLPTDACFEPIRELQRASNTFPHWLTKRESPQFQFLPEKYLDSRDDLCSAVTVEFELGGAIATDDDDLRLSAAIPIIFQTYHHHKVATKFPGQPTEMDMRIGIDGLVAHIHDTDINETRPSRYWAERGLKLPRSSSDINITTTTTDGFSFLIFPKFLAYDSIREVKRALASYSTAEYKELIVTHCVWEYKRTDSGRNKAMMGLVSALYQRKGLDMRDQFVFGVFQDDTHCLQVVAAIWQKDYPQIKVYKVGEYSLTPMTAVQLYLVLRAIKQLSYKYHEDIQNSEASFYRAVRVKGLTNEWAQKSKPMLDAGDSEQLDENSDEAPYTVFEPTGPEPTSSGGLQRVLAAVGELDGVRPPSPTRRVVIG